MARDDTATPKGPLPDPAAQLVKKLIRLRDRERRVEAETWEAVAGKPHLLPCLQLVEAAMDALIEVIDGSAEDSPEARSKLHLAARLWSSTAASLSLIRAGYPQQSLLLQRDLLEHGQLIEYFCQQPKAFGRWRKCSSKVRKTQFSPGAIREQLSKTDSAQRARRKEIYSVLSRYAAHPDPEAHRVVLTAGGVQVGPFYDEERVRMCLISLCWWTLHATAHFSRFADTPPSALQSMASFQALAKKWLQGYGHTAAGFVDPIP